MARKKYKFYKNPIKWYINLVKNSIEPTNPSHKVTMKVEIPKGKKEGRALIPCAIYTMDHSIDVNPSLIKKKDKKFIKHLPTNKKLEYDPRKYDVILTEDEKNKGYVLEELERCKECGSRVVIAEIAETRYRSCPDVKVRISDKAKEDLIIPIEFGIRKSQVYTQLIFPLILDLLFIYAFLEFFGISFFDKLGIFPLFEIFPLIVKISLGLLIGIFFLHCLVFSHYKLYKLYKWYNKVNPTLKKVKNYRHRR